MKKRVRNQAAGTRRLETSGYVKVKMPDGSWQYEHRVVTDASSGELVHHKDRVKSNNAPDNLEKMTSSEHVTLHLAISEWALGFLACTDCGTSETPHAAKGLCDRCYQRAATVRRGKAIPARMMTEECRECLRSGRQYRAHGLCHACYARERRSLKKLAA